MVGKWKCMMKDIVVVMMLFGLTRSCGLFGFEKEKKKYGESKHLVDDNDTLWEDDRSLYSCIKAKCNDRFASSVLERMPSEPQ